MTQLAHAPVVLWKLPPLWGLPSPSPFVVKLETWLRMAEIPYRSRHLSRPPQSRSGKIPYIELPSGELVSDSGQIIERLSAERGVDLDAGLTPQQLALGHVVRRTIEEHLYFHGLHGRWVDDAGFAAVSAPDGYFSKLSGPARFLISRYLRRNLIRMSWAQGVGRHTPEQRRDAAHRDVDALATLLGDRDYLLGSPSTVDATLLGFGWGMVVNPYPSMVADAFNAHPNLVAYIERMKGRYWADWTG